VSPFVSLAIKNQKKRKSKKEQGHYLDGDI
jgi:hypothetical protein